MPPQRVQRMVQYSEPVRPGMMRSTASRPLHSGQVDRAVGLVSACDMVGPLSLIILLAADHKTANWDVKPFT